MYQKKRKIYSLLRVKREEVQEFVKDQLRKGYIRPLKSPQTSPVFFVPKKDGKKRMVMKVERTKRLSLLRPLQFLPNI